MNRIHIKDLLPIVQSVLAIILSLIALYAGLVNRAKTKDIEEGLGKLTQETMYLAYYTKIITPENNQHFDQHYIKMEISFGRDLAPGDHIWVVGFDGNSKYPLRKIDMAKGQRIWSSNIELPHMQEWTLNVYQVDLENSEILQQAYEQKQHLRNLASTVFSYLGSVNVIYNDRRGN